LWGAILFLAGCVLVLAVLLIWSVPKTSPLPEPGGVSPPGSAKPDDQSDEPVAVIGDRTITYGELHQRLLEKYGSELLNQMLDREAIRLEALALAIDVSREDIEKELKRMQQGYESEEQFYKSMREQLGLSKEELSEDVYYKLLLERIATHSIEVTDAEVQQYINDHPEEFSNFTQYHLFKIEVKTEREVQDIMDALRNGADFEQLARERSIDSNTAEKGGDMGWVEDYDPFVSPFILETARLLEKGEIGGPVPLGGSFAVIRLADKKEVRKTIDDETMRNVRRELALQKAPPLQELVKTLRAKRNATILASELR